MRGARRVARTLFLAALLPLGPAQAQCRDTTQNVNCSVEECAARQSVVHPRCDQQPRNCNQLAETAENLALLQQYLQNAQDCVDARLSVEECYAAVDRGHRIAIENARRSVAVCEQAIEAVTGR